MVKDLRNPFFGIEKIINCELNSITDFLTAIKEWQWLAINRNKMMEWMLEQLKCGGEGDDDDDGTMELLNRLVGMKQNLLLSMSMDVTARSMDLYRQLLSLMAERREW